MVTPESGHLHILAEKLVLKAWLHKNLLNFMAWQQFFKISLASW